MTVFKDTEQLYSVFDALFRRMSDRREIVEPLLDASFVLRFRYREPEGLITADLRGDQLTWSCGESELDCDLELIQSGDVAHLFWLGELNVPLAIASRKIVSRGEIAKALALLPAVKPAFPIYRQVLEELGLAELLPVERSTSGRSLGQRLRSLFHLGGGRTLALEGLEGLDASPIPLLAKGETDLAPPPLRDVALPEDPDDLVREMLSRMLLIRRFEETLSTLYADGEVPTEAIHLSIGQEATAVGTCFALRAADYLATTHRGHGHLLAKGAPVDGMMAEILGKVTGLCRGKGGSMHVTDARVGAIGANGIVGASPLLAAGAAHSIRRQGDDRVAVAFFGDGATNQGMFHEALNFAAVFELPAVFVLENNLYGEFTPLAAHTRVARLEDRALSYGMPARTVDGNDVRAVHAAMEEAVDRARGGGGPTLLVCDTYRWHGHMEGETVPYRSAEEIADWKARCPIESLRDRLIDEGRLDDEGYEALEREAGERIEAALAFARESAEPELSILEEDVFSPDPEALHRAPVVAGEKPRQREISCAQAIREALAEELERDPSVYLLGEDVRGGGYFAVTAGLSDDFGPERIVDTPISEYAIVGSAVGAAMTGSRPVAEILFSDFLTTCMDPIVNNAAKLRLMSGGQYQMPLVVRTPGGAGLGMAAQHSQSLEALLCGVPGLIVMAPSTPADSKGLLKAAIRSNNPVVFFENKLAYAAVGPVPEGDHLVPIGVADIKREGRDLTLVAIGGALNQALEAARLLARRGIEVEVIDPRTLVPLDLETILKSVQKTGRLCTLEEAPKTHGFGAEIVARVSERAFGLLRAPPRRLAARDLPIAYAPGLERATLPSVEGIVTSLSTLAA